MIVHDSTAVPIKVHDDARDFVTAERFSATAGVESGKLSKSTWPRLSTHAHAHPHFQASFVYSLAAWHPVFWPFVVLFILITSVPRTAASRPKRPPIGCLRFFFACHLLPGDHDVHADWRDGHSLHFWIPQTGRVSVVASPSPILVQVNVVNSVAASEREGSTVPLAKQDSPTLT